MTVPVAVAISLGLLVLSAFFVAAEFALVASKRHRLEEGPGRDRRSVRAALAGISDLPMTLAGAQLGITLCALGLGHIAKPAVVDVVDPLLAGTGLPAAAGHAIAVVIALSIVTFLHMVVGEMAPKSWAITHPEKSAMLLAIPFAVYTRVTGPALHVLNRIANLMLKPFGIEPQNELRSAHSADDLTILLRHSQEHGMLPRQQYRLMDRLLALRNRRVEQLMVARERIATVPEDATPADIERASLRSGRSRLGVTDAHGEIVGVVHVHEAMRATGRSVAGDAASLMTAPLRLTSDRDAHDALRTMQQRRSHLALVTRDGAVLGLVSLEDIIEQLIDRFEDETDPVPATASGAR